MLLEYGLPILGLVSKGVERSEFCCVHNTLFIRLFGSAVIEVAAGENVMHIWP